MDINRIADNIKRNLDNLNSYTKTPGNGVTRLPFTDEARQAIDYLTHEMEAVGLKVHVDNSGAVIGRYDGLNPDNPVIMIGSHYDTVLSGGGYDGIGGVVTSIEIARILIESGEPINYPIEVVATNDEEGIIYGVGFISSKAICGKWTADDLKTLKDADGESIWQAMERFGLNPNEIDKCIRKPEEIKCFIEVHIEQGPVLESEGESLGLVECIAGIDRYRFKMIGQSNHAGGTPMYMRHDAVEAAAMVVSCIPEWARQEGGGTVATVGYFSVTPNALNTIAGAVEWTVDLRSADMDKIDNIKYKIMNKIQDVEEKTGVKCETTHLIRIEPGVMKDTLVDLLEKSANELGYSNRRMLSGASHDAHIFCEIADTAMVFVPSYESGVSHSPKEHSEPIDFAKAAVVAARAISSV